MEEERNQIPLKNRSATIYQRNRDREKQDHPQESNSSHIQDECVQLRHDELQNQGTLIGYRGSKVLETLMEGRI